MKHASDNTPYKGHRFSKIVIWIIMILLSSALLMQPLIPLFQKFFGSSSPEIKNQQQVINTLKNNIQVNNSNVKVETTPKEDIETPESSKEMPPKTSEPTNTDTATKS